MLNWDPEAKIRSLNSVLNVGAFNQENALVGAYSVIVKLRVIFGNIRFKLYAAHRHMAAAATIIVFASFMNYSASGEC